MGGLGSAGRASRSGAPFHEQQSTGGVDRIWFDCAENHGWSGRRDSNHPRRPLGRSGSEDSDGSIALKITAGAGEGIRTLDPNLGKVVLYP